MEEAGAFFVAVHQLVFWWFLRWWSSAILWLSTFNKSPILWISLVLASSYWYTYTWKHPQPPGPGFSTEKFPKQTFNFCSSNQLEIEIRDLQLPFVRWPCSSVQGWTGQKLQRRTRSPCWPYFAEENTKTYQRKHHNNITTSNNGNSNNNRNKKQETRYKKEQRKWHQVRKQNNMQTLSWPDMHDMHHNGNEFLT